MKGARLRKPVVGQSLDPFPREAIFLASTPERVQPVLDHMVAESADSQSVGRHGMIGIVAPDDLRQPTSLLGYRLMHALAQLLLDLREPRPHAVTSALTMYEELTPTCFATDEDKA